MTRKASRRGASIRRRLGVAAASALLSFVVLEVGVRAVGSVDEDGNFRLPLTVLGRPIRAFPLRLPVVATRQVLDRYLADPSPRLLYDPVVGWVPRDDAWSSPGDGVAEADLVGVRPHILLFGDSFTAGAEVDDDETWGRQLEARLRATMPAPIVVNFAVGAHGIDQAYLRWQAIAEQARPKLVLWGFQPENVKRNLSAFWPVYRAPGIPFGKPRFTLEAGELRLRNVPVPRPETVPDLLARLDSWPDVALESAYDAERYGDSVWRRSRVLGLAAGCLHLVRETLSERRFYALQEEPAQLTLAIVGAFARSVEAVGAEFAIVHHPRQIDLGLARFGRSLVYGDLLAELARRHTVVDPMSQLAEAGRDGLGELFEPGTHYSAKAHAIVARVIDESGVAQRALR